MYVIISQIVNVDHLTIDQAKDMCLLARGEGKRSEIISTEEANKRGYLDPMQDLAKIKDWSQVK